MPQFPLITETGDGRREGIMAGKSLRCRLGMHKWVVHRDIEAGAWHQCARCGKERTPDVNPPAVGGMMAEG